MNTNAHRALRISLVISIVLSGLLFAVQSFAAQTHTVRRGETLYIIAKKYHTSVSALQKLNHLKSVNTIEVGQVLKLSTDAPSISTRPETYGISKEDKLEILSSDGKVITTMQKGNKFIVLGREGDKFNVSLTGGRTGWVRADAVTLKEGEVKPLPTSSQRSWRNDLVQTAYAFRGARYRRGGMSASGFDCSGFVKYIYATKGIKLPHDSRALYKYGKPVAKSDLQPGDILFFAGTYRHGISHVGLYMGEGKFIHASTSRGGVRVDYLEAEYYRRHYAGAKRI